MNAKTTQQKKPRLHNEAQKSRDTNNNGNKVVGEMNRKENNQGKKLLLFIMLYHLN